MHAALCQLAQKMLEPSFDVTTITAKLAGVSALTEELLMLASDAVEVVAAAAAGKSYNVKDKFCLLLALVAGVMGSQKGFNRPDGARWA